jgi:iron-sulfur cluster repair protein YtfE (RIC family)
MAFQNDMTMMYVFHDALRRDLDCISRVTARTDDDPKAILRTAAGWEMFQSYLHVHHSTEDEMLWPPLRGVLSDDSYANAVFQAMEAEHARINPLLDAIDAALVDRDSGPARLGELADALASALRSHLDHEEKEGLPVIDSAITAEQWQAFSAAGAKQLSGDVSRLMPWMLDGAAPDVTASVLGLLPPPVLEAYRDQWRPGYATLRRWG